MTNNTVITKPSTEMYDTQKSVRHKPQFCTLFHLAVYTSHTPGTDKAERGSRSISRVATIKVQHYFIIYDDILLHPVSRVHGISLSAPLSDTIIQNQETILVYSFTDHYQMHASLRGSGASTLNK